MKQLACNLGLEIREAKMINESDREIFIKLSKMEKSKLLLCWLKDLVLKNALTMEDVLDLFNEIS